MSSTVASGAATPARSIDPRQLHGSSPDLPRHALAAPIDMAYLSSLSYQHYSSSSSPSAALTPANAASENSGYSEFSDYGADEFFGVNFDADGHDLILDTDLVGGSVVPPAPTAGAKYALLQGGKEVLLDAPPAASAPLMTPDPTRSRMPSPNLNHLPAVKTFVPQNTVPSDGRNTASTPSSTSFTLSVNTAEQLVTPDMSGNTSHTSAEGVANSMGVFTGHSPRVTLTTWNSTEEHDLSTDPEDQGTAVAAGSQSGPGYFAPRDAKHSSKYNVQVSMAQSSNRSSPDDKADDDRDDEGARRRGIDPTRRKSFSDVEVPNFKDKARREEMEAKRREVEEWRSQAGDNSVEQDEGSSRLYTGLAAPVLNRVRSLSTGAMPHSQNSSHSFPSWEAATPHQIQPEEDDDGIRPVSPTASIRENKLQEGQIYFNKHVTKVTEEDKALMQLSRHWVDGVAYPDIVQSNVEGKGPTAKEMMEKWNATADTFSIISRSATWGTRRRRRSAPSIEDTEAVTSGSVLKRLSFGKGNEKKPGIFNSLNNALGSVVRKKSVGESGKLKRNRSNNEFVERGRLPASPLGKKENSSTLAPPANAPSNGRVRPQSPRLNTNFGNELTPGDSHTRRASIGSTTPKAIGGFFNNVNNAIRRSRSKSEMSPDMGLTGLAGQWRNIGGPPVPNLTSPPIDIEDGHANDDQQMHDASDVDGDEDDEDDLADDGDMQFDLDTPIVATMDGFRDHVRKLNPMMEPGYLVDRLAHQQMVRYKNLLGWRIKHSSDLSDGGCSSAEFCLSMGGAAKYYETKAKGRTGLNKTVHVEGDGSDSNPENALGADSFPDGVPKPPAVSLPAEFECQLCFKVKKFQKPSDWTKHVHEDVQPFTCTYQSCREPKSFKRKADWVRHENERHRHLEWWTCRIDDCNHKCFRKDNFLQHLVREHKLPEPKTKSKAAIKRATGAEEEVWARVTECRHETNFRPIDEPCKFCGRTFASWKKLTVHLGKHMEQISLPVLNLVNQRPVDANTIISPVEALPARSHHQLTPIELHSGGPSSGGPSSAGNPFHSSNISPNLQHFPQFQSGMVGFQHTGVGMTDFSGDAMYNNHTHLAFANPSTNQYPYGVSPIMSQNQYQHQQPDMLTGVRSGPSAFDSIPLDHSNDHTPLLNQSSSFAHAQGYSPHSLTPQRYAYTSSTELSPTPPTYPVTAQQQQQQQGDFPFIPTSQNLSPESYLPTTGYSAMRDGFGLGVGLGYSDMPGGGGVMPGAGDMAMNTQSHGLPFVSNGQMGLPAEQPQQTSPYSAVSSSSHHSGGGGGGFGSAGGLGVGVDVMPTAKARSSSGGRSQGQGPQGQQQIMVGQGQQMQGQMQMRQQGSIRMGMRSYSKK